MSFGTRVEFEARHLIFYGGDLAIARLAEHYRHCQSDLTLLPDSVDAFIDEFTEIGEWDICDLRNFNSRFLAISNETAVLVSGTTCVVFSCESAQNVANFVLDHSEFFARTDDESNILITYFYTKKGDLQNSSVAVGKKDVGDIYPELYPTIDIDRLSKQYLASPDKILILYGSPGTGKTTFVKSVMSNGDYGRIAYTKDAATIKNDAFWLDLQMGRYDLVIFDDLDAGLQRHDDKEDAFVTKLLSFSDGILVNKTKIIVTTNQNIEHVDPAILRPGRCFDFLELQSLDRSQAKHFWTQILKHDIDSFSLEGNTITQAELMMRHLHMESNIGNRDYIKDGSTMETRLDRLGITSGTKTAGFQK